MHAIRRFAHRIYQTARSALIPRPQPSSPADDSLPATASEFHLDLLPTTAIALHATNASVREVLPLDGNGGMRLQMQAGDALVTPSITLSDEHVVRLRASAPARTTLHVEMGASGHAWSRLVTWRPSSRPLPLELELGIAAGFPRRLRVVSEGGRLEIFEFQVCARHRRGRLHALTSYAHRMQNEVKHFAGALYAKAILGDLAATPARGDGILRTATGGGAATDLPAELGRRAEALLATMPPMPDEKAFAYAMRGLGALLPITPPDFFARAARRSAAGPLSILSLCSGAARVEEQILAHCRGPVRLTLLDASAELSQRAADRLSRAGDGRTVDCLVGDVNRGLPGNDRYDVIVCVSALHHVADLETVLAQANERLVDDGEFWSIGEQIGRNGNRLWPETLVAANRAFARLPAHLRRNAHSGQTDEQLSDQDFSVASFEGIRSEELETMLEAHFVPEHVYKRNAFLWRLVDAAYADNFDLRRDDDVRELRRLVVAEAVHWATGGRATELHGVYRKKTLRAASV